MVRHTWDKEIIEMGAAKQRLIDARARRKASLDAWANSIEERKAEIRKKKKLLKQESLTKEGQNIHDSGTAGTSE